MAIAVTASSCLITQPVHFDEPANSPPAIYDTSPSTFPLSNVIQMVPTGADGGLNVMLPLTVVVYDADVGQTLSWRVFVDNTLHLGDDLGPSSLTTGRERRSLGFTVTAPQLLTAGCHRIDLFVSGGFTGMPTDHAPREPNDVAAATWWVNSGGAADLGGCIPLGPPP